MNKVEVGTLDSHELFEHRGVIYEVLYKTDYCVRCQNRQIHKANFLKGGRKKLNQAPFLVKGFRLFDLVEYQNDLYYIFGRRDSGFFDIRKLNGTKVNKGSINCKHLRLMATRKSILIEKRMQINYENTGF